MVGAVAVLGPPPLEPVVMMVRENHVSLVGTLTNQDQALSSLRAVLPFRQAVIPAGIIGPRVPVLDLGAPLLGRPGPALFTSFHWSVGWYLLLRCSRYVSNHRVRYGEDDHDGSPFGGVGSPCASSLEGVTVF